MKSERRKRAALRLEKQLKDGVKPYNKRYANEVPEGAPIPKTLPLTKRDQVRIYRELQALKDVV